MPTSSYICTYTHNTHTCAHAHYRKHCIHIYLHIGFGYMSLSVCVCVSSSVVYWWTSAYKYPCICVSACVDVKGRNQMSSSIVLGLIFAVEYIIKPEAH